MKSKPAIIFCCIIVTAAVGKASWYQFSHDNQTESTKTRSALFKSENSNSPQAQLFKDDFDQNATPTPVGK